MGTFSGILSGAAEQAPFYFPFAFHGTRQEYLPGIAARGLQPAKDYPESLARHRPAGARRAKKVPVLYFSPCVAYAARYARVSKKSALLRFPWPEDARGWVTDHERRSLAAMHIACKTGRIPPHPPERVNRRVMRSWWWAEDFEYDRKTFCAEEGDLGNRQYVSSLVVPSRDIEVFVGSITEPMTRSCRENDTRFKQWIPLRDYLAGTKK